MNQIITIINHKGGVGKSTTAAALAAGLARAARPVLSIDLDAQCNLTHICGADSEGLTATDVLTGNAAAEEAVQHTDAGDIIAGDKALWRADSLLTDTAKWGVLQSALADIRSRYDFILVDTPPALSILTIAALTVSTGAIIPAQADILSLQGIADLNATVERVRERSNAELRILGILITRYNARATISRNAADTLSAAAARIGTSLFKTRIRECAAIREAQALRLNIFKHAPRSNAAKDYSALLDEITGGLENG